jgi:adenylate cyclase class 2
MDEIEVKVLGVDVDEIKNRILAKAGNLVKKEMQENYLYELPEGLENRNGYVRIRKVHSLIDNKDTIFLCIKKILSQDKYRKTEEHEFEVKDFTSCQEFLNSLGLSFHKQRNKYRESYMLNDTLIEIDIWDKSEFPEPYIELEAVSENKIYETMSLLDLAPERATSKLSEQIKKEMGLL